MRVDGVDPQHNVPASAIIAQVIFTSGRCNMEAGGDPKP